MRFQSSILLAVCLLLSVSLPTIAKPNFIFLFSDDHSYEAVGYAGITEVKTPNIDRLADSGSVFSHAYNMGSWSGAVCIGSRTMLNTGRTVHRANSMATSNAQSWAGIMKSGGYTTYYIGKWHVSKVSYSIFDIKGTLRPGMPNQTASGYNRPTDTSNPYKEWAPWDAKKGGHWKGGTHWSEVTANEAVKFINQAKSKDEPFFMYVAFNAPHDPRQSPKEFVEMYPYREVAVPKDFRPTYLPMADLGKLGIDAGLRDEKLAPFPRTEFSVQVNRQEHYAIVTHMDVQIGRILDALEASGKKDSTYVIFTSDHGLACGHHGFMGKQNMYDHSIRAPWVITGPGIPKKKTFDSKIYLQDAMATTIDLAGISKPSHVEFNSVMPIINGTKDKLYDEMYISYLSTMRAVIKGDYKLIYYPPLNRARLYNERNDSLELTDLIDSPKHAAVIDTLWKTFEEVSTAIGNHKDYSYKLPAISGEQVPLVGEATGVRQNPISVAYARPGNEIPAAFSVFTASGRLVGTFGNDQKEVRWNGRSPSGSAVRSGIYFVKFGGMVMRRVVR